MSDDAIACLERGGVVAAPTESFYGLLADATNPRAIDALLALKPRGADKGLPLLLPSLLAWEGLVADLPPVARRLAAALWPGPLTIALPATSYVDPRCLLEGEVAVRLPGPCAAAVIAERFGRPLTATSANQPGEAPAVTDSEVRSALPNAPRDGLVVVPGRAPGGAPSTIVTVGSFGYRVVRAGAVPTERVHAAARG